MKITEYASIGKSSKTSKKKESSAAGGADFLGLLSSPAETETSGTAPSVGDIQPVNSMDTLLSLQELPDDEVRKRRAVVEESKNTLDALETLRTGLLTGSIPEHLLTTLTKVVAVQKQKVTDPRLTSIIEDIELRAAVELAKLERAQQAN